MENWPFDQDKNVSAITTRQVLRDGYPILNVVHYSDDHSWAFTCGTTDDSADGLVVGMGCIVEHDPSVLTSADLPPGWGASRAAPGKPWVRYENADF
jgi:hypothetical protein